MSPSPTPPTQASGTRHRAAGRMNSAAMSAQPRPAVATPVAGDGVHPEDDRELLEQTEEALGREVDAEDLEPTAEDPDAAGPVEVEVVGVGQVAVEEPLREDEHEALFHRCALAPQHAPQRERYARTSTPNDDRVRCRCGAGA